MSGLPVNARKSAWDHHTSIRCPRGWQKDVVSVLSSESTADLSKLVTLSSREIARRIKSVGGKIKIESVQLAIAHLLALGAVVVVSRTPRGLVTLRLVSEWWVGIDPGSGINGGGGDRSLPGDQSETGDRSRIGDQSSRSLKGIDPQIARGSIPIPSRVGSSDRPDRPEEIITPDPDHDSSGARAPRRANAPHTLPASPATDRPAMTTTATNAAHPAQPPPPAPSVVAPPLPRNPRPPTDTEERAAEAFLTALGCHQTAEMAETAWGRVEVARMGAIVCDLSTPQRIEARREIRDAFAAWRIDPSTPPPPLTASERRAKADAIMAAVALPVAVAPREGVHLGVGRPPSSLNPQARPQTTPEERDERHRLARDRMVELYGETAVAEVEAKQARIAQASAFTAGEVLA